MVEPPVNASPPGDVSLPVAFAWMPWMDACVQWQRAHWDVLAAWQRAFAEMQNELFDEWACRWAGGAPIDA